MDEAPLLRELSRSPRSLAEIRQAQHDIQRQVLAQSRALDAANFTQFHVSDLSRMFALYDDIFFAGACRRQLGKTSLSFRISRRMTSAGGKTTRRILRNAPYHRSYEITISSTLLFQTFHDVDRTVTVTGLTCRSRLEALQRIFEHELVHLIEMLVWDNSHCSQPRFQSIAGSRFGHTEHRHELVTPRERAQARFGLKPGSRVWFEMDGVRYLGVINRITRRATVLVEDPRGIRYSDGCSYLKFYVPFEMLHPVS